MGTEFKRERYIHVKNANQIFHLIAISLVVFEHCSNRNVHSLIEVPSNFADFWVQGLRYTSFLSPYFSIVSCLWHLTSAFENKKISWFPILNVFARTITRLICIRLIPVLFGCLVFQFHFLVSVRVSVCWIVTLNGLFSTVLWLVRNNIDKYNIFISTTYACIRTTPINTALCIV